VTLWCLLFASVSSYVKDCFWAADAAPSAAGFSPPSAGFSPPSAPSAGAPSVRDFDGYKNLFIFKWFYLLRLHQRQLFYNCKYLDPEHRFSFHFFRPMLASNLYLTNHLYTLFLQQHGPMGTFLLRLHTHQIHLRRMGHKLPRRNLSTLWLQAHQNIHMEPHLYINHKLNYFLIF
jgi:hypothetical protein